MIEGKSELKEYYNRKEISGNYSRNRFVRTSGRLQHDFEIAIINNALSRKRKPKILEIAVGPGRITKDIKGAGIGIDASENMLKIAKKAAPGWKFIKMDMMRMKFNNKFDFIITLRLLRHFDKKDRIKAYKKIHENLAKNGMVIFDMPTDVHNSILELIAKFRKKDHIYEADVPVNELKKELKDTGFSIDKIYNTKYDTFFFKFICLVNDYINIFYPLLTGYMRKHLTNIKGSSNLIIIAKK